MSSIDDCIIYIYYNNSKAYYTDCIINAVKFCNAREGYTWDMLIDSDITFEDNLNLGILIKI